MPTSSDFRVKNGLIIGSSGTGTVCAGSGLFTSSLSSAALSGCAAAGIRTGATISLGGDLGGSVSLDTLDGTKTLTATIQANSVALGTDTTGSYLESFALNTTTPSLTGTIGTGEGATITGLGLSATGVTAAAYGSSTAIPVITVLEDGRLSSVSTSSISTDLTIAADSGSNDTVTLGTDTLTFAGTNNEIETTVSDNQIQIGLPNDVTIAGNLTVNGTCTTLNTEVTSTTTATENNFVIVSTDSGADAAPDLKLYRNSSSPADNDRIGNLFFTGRNDNSQDVNYSQLETRITDASDGSEDAYLTFKTMAAGTLAERMTIKSGLVGIGTTNPNEELTVSGTLSASTSVCSPLIAAATCLDSALTCGTAGHFGSTLIGGGYGSTGATITSTGVLSADGLIYSGTCVCSPVIAASTSFSSPSLSGTTVCGDTIRGGGGYGSTGATITSTGNLSADGTVYSGSCVCSPIVIGSTCVDSALICGTAASFGGGFGSTGITIGNDGSLCSNGKFSIGTSATNACLTVAGTISASGVVYGDAFESATGGSAISFNDNVTLSGTLSATDHIVHVGDPNTRISFDTDLITTCAAGCNLLRVDGSRNVVGIGTVTTASPSVPSVVEFNNNTTAYRSASATINDAASAAILSFPYSTYRTGKIIVQAVGIGGSSAHVESSELLITHNNSDTFSTEYGTIRTCGTIGTYTAEIVGSNVELRVTNGLGAQACFIASIQHLMT